MSVVGEERKRTILEKVEFKGKVKVSELAREFAVSTETIRRYLEELDREKKLKSVWWSCSTSRRWGRGANVRKRNVTYRREEKNWL